MAESAVKRAKKLLKKTLETKGDIDIAVLEYNSTPIAHLGASPAQMLMSRVLRTQIPISNEQLKPKVINVEEKRKIHSEKVESHYNQTCKIAQEFHSNEKVWLIHQNGQWHPAVIVKKLADFPRSYLVKSSEGSILRRNSKFLRKRITEERIDPSLLLFFESESDIKNDEPTLPIDPTNQGSSLEHVVMNNNDSGAQIEGSDIQINGSEEAEDRTHDNKSENCYTESEIGNVFHDSDDDVTFIDCSLNETVIEAESIFSSSDSSTSDFLGFNTEPLPSSSGVSPSPAKKTLKSTREDSPQIAIRLRNAGRGVPIRKDPNFVSK